MKILNVLDIDLDFFLDGIALFCSEGRLSSEDYSPWEEGRVRKFLEQNCKLSSKNKIKGKIFKDHNEVFFFLRDLALRMGEPVKFSIDHVDAHSDTGNGDLGFNYIFKDLLHRPKPLRLFPKESEVKISNYLIFLACADLIRSLNFISLENDFSDLGFMYFNLPKYPLKKDMYGQPILKLPHSIQLRLYNKNRFKTGASISQLAYTNPDENFKRIPFRHIWYPHFETYLKYDYIFLTKSPEYTPVESDDLIDVIKEYMKEVWPLNMLHLQTYHYGKFRITNKERNN
nr:hypothetical protein [uncultured Carboxylicivirga sp.]